MPASLAHIGQNPRLLSLGSRKAAFTHPFASEAMNIKVEGRCFLCREKGHIAKDCPKINPASPATNPARDEETRLNAIIDRLYTEKVGKRVELLEDSDKEDEEKTKN